MSFEQLKNNVIIDPASTNAFSVSAINNRLGNEMRIGNEKIVWHCMKFVFKKQLIKRASSSICTRRTLGLRKLVLIVKNVKKMF